MSDFLDQFLCGDSLEVLKTLPTGCADLVITSPPYNIRNSTGGGFKSKKTYGTWKSTKLHIGYDGYTDDLPYEEYVEYQRNVLTECMRIIPENGAIFYNHKWRVQGGLIQDRSDIVSGFPVRQIIIWQRSGGINFNSSFFLPTYEVIYMIAKKDFRLRRDAIGLGDVWKINQDTKNLDHPAPFPLELPERIIRSTDAKVILDPFMGSGTTALAAKKLGRTFIGIDRSEKYCKMAEQRLETFNPKHTFF